MIGTLLGIAAMTYAGFALVLYLLQPSLIYFPEIDRALAATPQQAGLPYEDVKLVTADGVTLHGWLIPAGEPPRGTVLFFHGNAGNISHRLDSLRMFHRLGYRTLIFDYRGYGNSGGAPTEQGTYRDAEAAWDYLTQTRNIPATSIVLFGESLGGAVAAWLASRHTPAALVISSGFTSVPDLAADIYPFMPVRWLARFHYDTRAHVAASNTPVFIAHSPDDEIIPFRHGRALFAAAQQPKRFLELQGGHNEGFIFVRETWIQALGEFLQANVSVGGSTHAKDMSDKHAHE